MKYLFLFITIITINFNSFSQETSQPEKGDKIGDFSALNDNGKLWNSSEVNTQFLVVYFYPAAMTSGCTKQACAYRDDKSKLEKMGITVIGISGDKVENLKHFKEAYHLNFTLLSDAEGKLAHKFGVPTSKGGAITKAFNGNNFLLTRGITASRWTFVLDKNRKIIYKNSKVNAAEDSKNIMEIISKIKKS
jgi:peroxiredoxin Q/BCP